MNKILYFLIIATAFVPSFYTKEPTIATLRAVYSNSHQKFSIAKYEFSCRPYGIITIDELYLQAKANSICEKSVSEFYRQNPKAKYFSSLLLKIRQNYHVGFRNNRCIIYANGLNSLSELLLKEGLAIKKTMFKDKEFDYLFTEAQIDAKENKIGMYKNKIKNKCISEVFELEKKSN